MPRNVNFKKPPTPNEPITRYLTHRKQFSPVNNRVKPGAFMPPQDLQLSVSRIYGLSIKDIWKIGTKVIKKSRQKLTLYGRADIKVLTVTTNGLSIDPDNKPRRHANVIGWPPEKEEQKSIALELANKATLVLSS
jgi:hypothetical protein